MKLINSPKIIFDSSSKEERRGFLKKLGAFAAGVTALGGFTNLKAKNTYSGTEIIADASAGSYIGSISMIGCNYAPKDWAYCNGDLLSIADNSALFSLIGATFGGDGKVKYALPDMRGRVPVNKGIAKKNGKEIMFGESFGSETISLDTDQIPIHNHEINITKPKLSLRMGGHTSLLNDLSDDPEGNVFAKTHLGEMLYSSSTANTDMAEGMVSIEYDSEKILNIEPTGEGKPFSVMQPWLCVNFIICVQGLYPTGKK